MPPVFRPSGPTGVVRPFSPNIGDANDPAHKIAHALEHIAMILSAIDHNLEVITQNTIKIANKR